MSDAASGALVDAVREQLRAAADPARAPGAQAYMKSTMPFYGVPVPEARKITRAAAAEVKDAATLLGASSRLWDEASHREERYAAMALLALRPLKGDPALVEPIEHMVRTGRWWDFTDELAHRVAELLDADPQFAGALVREWSGDEDFWIRRIAIIAQVGRRERVDNGLLADVIEPNLADREFFIRKAIGWALRDRARTDPGFVLAFAASHTLSPLSRREALKHLGG